VLDTLKARPAKMAIYSAYQDPKPDEWLSEHAHIPAVKIAFTVGGTDGAKDLTGLYDDTVTRLVGALK
jgi:zinc/manganese transport system substrate-binding protein